MKFRITQTCLVLMAAMISHAAEEEVKDNSDDLLGKSEKELASASLSTKMGISLVFITVMLFFIYCTWNNK